MIDRDALRLQRPTDKMIPLPEGMWDGNYEQKERRASRAHDKGLWPCEICGRGVADGRGYIVHVIGGGGEILHPDEPLPEWDEACGADMGWWVLGPECGKKVPAAYRKARQSNENEWTETK